MATDERLFDLFRELEQPMPPDAAFSERLYGRLKAEAGFAVTSRPSGPRWLPRLRAPAARPLVLTPRLVMLVLLALLLAAGIAVAGYIAVQGWLSTGPRGIQFSDEFTFAEVYRDGGQPIEPGPMPVGIYYADFAMSEDGSALYAVRLPAYPDPGASLVRLSDLADPTIRRDDLFDFVDLADPALWDAGIETSKVDIGMLQGTNGDILAVAPDGQIFLVAGAYGRERVPVPRTDSPEQELRANWPDITDDEIERVTTRPPLLAASLIAVRPDGVRQRVITVAELWRAGLLPESDARATISVVASSADRLWVGVDVFNEESMATSLFQIVDPDRNKDWTDRVVLPILLPDDVPWPTRQAPASDPAAQQWQGQGLVAELSTERVDRTRSVLQPMRATTGEYRVYRLTDANGDGDLRGSGETELVFTAEGVSGAGGHTLASRVVVQGAAEVLRELLVSGVTGPSRIARIDANGDATDIARALASDPEDIEAAPNGDIFVMVQESGTSDLAPALVVYRLAPVPAAETGASASPSAAITHAPGSPLPLPTAAETGGSASPSAGITQAPGSPSPSPTAAETITPGVPRIAYLLEDWDFEAARILAVGADGSGPTELVPGEHNTSFCHSADGSLIAFRSDEEVPHEPVLYVAKSGGTERRMIAGGDNTFWCGFSSRYILIKSSQPTLPIVRYDLETGEETDLMHASRLQADPFGRRYLFVESATLRFIDVETSEQQELHGPLPPGQRFDQLTWSPDGAFVAFTVGPPSDDPGAVVDLEIYVQEVGVGNARLVHASKIPTPSLAFSSDASHLLISPSCTCEPSPELVGLTLVDLKTGEARTVADQVTWAGWHPTEATPFAYATKDRLYVASTDGVAEKVASAPAEGVCPDCGMGGAPAGEWGWGTWIGWSPDGRYIGLPDVSGVIGVIEIENGQLAILTTDVGDEAFLSGGRWLR